MAVKNTAETDGSPLAPRSSSRLRYWGIDSRVMPCQIISLESNLNANARAAGLILDFTDSTLDRFEVGSNMLVSSRLNCNEGESIEYVSETLIQSAAAGSKCANEKIGKRDFGNQLETFCYEMSHSPPSSPPCFDRKSMIICIFCQVIDTDAE